ncbi:MAG: dihydrofolate reductase [Bacteroidota bacterium]
MIKSIIVAKAANHVIGKNNQLPWHMPADMQHFQRTTLGHHVIMGRKTFESLPGALAGRKLIILSRNADYCAPGCLSTTNLTAALSLAEQAGEAEVFIAGGGSVYQEAMPWVDKLYLTEIKAIIEGDTFFPVLAIASHKWVEIKRISYEADAKHPYAYDFIELTKLANP